MMPVEGKNRFVIVNDVKENIQSGPIPPPSERDYTKEGCWEQCEGSVDKVVEQLDDDADCDDCDCTIL